VRRELLLASIPPPKNTGFAPKGLYGHTLWSGNRLNVRLYGQEILDRKMPIHKNGAPICIARRLCYSILDAAHVFAAM
jgi:hypothetical protein